MIIFFVFHAWRFLLCGIWDIQIIQHLAAAELLDAKIILLWMCDLHALKAVGLTFQLDTKHTEHTAAAFYTGRCQFAVFLNDFTIDRRIRDARHFEVGQNILLCPERHRLRSGVTLVIRIAAGFEI